jgi:hypothetical protein
MFGGGRATQKQVPLRPDPYGLLAGLIEQDGERRRAYRADYSRQAARIDHHRGYHNL